MTKNKTSTKDTMLPLISKKHPEENKLLTDAIGDFVDTIEGILGNDTSNCKPLKTLKSRFQL